jgi:hypothetical protein
VKFRLDPETLSFVPYPYPNIFLIILAVLNPYCCYLLFARCAIAVRKELRNSDQLLQFFCRGLSDDAHEHSVCDLVTLAAHMDMLSNELCSLCPSPHGRG